MHEWVPRCGALASLVCEVTTIRETVKPSILRRIPAVHTFVKV